MTVKPDGNLLLQRQPVTGRELPARLGAAFAGASDRKLVIQADWAVACGRVVQVMEAGRDRGRLTYPSW